MSFLDGIAQRGLELWRDATQRAQDILAAARNPREADAQPLRRVLNPESFLPVQESEIQPEFGWTLESVQAALLAHSQGDIQAGQRLMYAMLRDPIMAHGVETRAESLTQVPLRFERPPECPEWLFEIWVAHWPDCMTASARQQVGEHRIVLGTGITNVTWAPDSTGRAWVPTNHIREPANLSWRSDPKDKRYYFNSIDGQFPVDSTGERWLLWKRIGQRPHLAGALLPLAVAWFTKQEAFRGWPSHNRSHVKPQRLLKVPADQRESDDVKRLVAQAQALLAGGVLIMPQYNDDLPNFDFELVEAEANTYKTFEDLIRLCDNYMTLVLLGAMENTQGSSASNAKAQTHDKVTLRKVKADAQSDKESIITLGRTFAVMNRQPAKASPIPVFDADPPEDQNQLAERQQKRALAGQELGGFIEKLDAHNEKLTAANKPPVDFEVDYLSEQIGLQLKRSQDGYQSRAM